MKITEASNVLILSHFYKRALMGGGPPQEVRDFFLPKVKKIFYIEHPFPYSEDHRSSMSIYERGKLIKQYFTPNLNGPELLFYFLDPLFTFIFLLIARSRFKLCIALDNLNTISVIPFSKLKVIDKLVFYTIDYNPKRFENETLNRVYHFLDRLACYNSDAIWVLSKKMDSARRKNGVSSKKMAKSILLPMGANLERITLRPLNKIKRNQIVYAGHLLEKQGIQLIIESMPRILRDVPKAKFVIIGQGEFEKSLKALVKKLKLEHRVKFKGFVRKHKDVEKILCESAVGVAPYVTDPDNYTQYTDPGKPKLYLGCGLPVIITDVPAISKTINKKRAGLLINYSPNSAADSIVKLLSDKKLYEEYKRNSIKLSKNYDTNTLITSALLKT